MRPLPPVLVDLLGTLDGRVAGLGARVASVRTDAVRRDLRRRRRPFADPVAAEPPSDVEIDATARWVIATSSARAGLRAGVVGIFGPGTVPTEATATAIATLRLAQRLAVVYGLDPETDRGKMATWRALAAGWRVELPERGSLGATALELAAPRTVGAVLLRRVLRSATRGTARASRLLPVVSAPGAATSAQRHVRAMGLEMLRVLRALAGFPGEPNPIEEALEVAPVRG